jgi:predicted RNase H-like HicB family nuclease
MEDDGLRRVVMRHSHLYSHPRWPTRAVWLIAETLARATAGRSRDSLMAHDIELSLAGMLARPSASVVGPPREVSDVIRQYVETALRKARYEKLRDGTFYGEVPRLRGVLATGASLEACRDQLAEVVEEWILVRVARGLSVPPLGKAIVRVKQAS